MKSGRFQVKYLIITQKLTFMNPADFTMKSGRFHEIHEIWQISGEIWWISGEMFQHVSDVSAKTLQFGGVHGGGYDPRFHEIQGHSPSPAFIKLNSFC